MSVFLVQPENPLKYGVLIESFEAGARTPAILLSSAQNNFPVAPAELAGKLTSLLNGLHPESGARADDLAVHYQKHPFGVTLHHRNPQQGGVSQPGLQVTVLDTLPAADRAALMAKLTPQFMGSLCHAVETAHKPEAAIASGPKNRPGL